MPRLQRKPTEETHRDSFLTTHIQDIYNPVARVREHEPKTGATITNDLVDIGGNTGDLCAAEFGRFARGVVQLFEHGRRAAISHHSDTESLKTGAEPRTSEIL